MKRMEVVGALCLIATTLNGAVQAQTIHDAARSGDPAAVREFIAGDSALVSYRDEAENTRLHFAVMGGRASVVELLLASGADANAVNYEHETAEYVFARQG